MNPKSKKPEWRQFESDIVKHSLIQRVDVVKIPEHVMMIQGFVVRKKTQFDFCASIDGVAAFFDAKYEGKSNVLNFKSRILAGQKVHQWEALQAAYDRGTIAGYIINLAQHGLIGWVSVPVLRELLKTHLSIDNKTPGVVWQKDTEAINLRKLLAGDLSKWSTLRKTLSTNQD